MIVQDLGDGGCNGKQGNHQPEGTYGLSQQNLGYKGTGRFLIHSITVKPTHKVLEVTINKK